LVIDKLFILALMVRKIRCGLLNPGKSCNGIANTGRFLSATVLGDINKNSCLFFPSLPSYYRLYDGKNNNCFLLSLQEIVYTRKEKSPSNCLERLSGDPAGIIF